MYGTLKKKYGQNFLIDQNVIKKICNLLSGKNLKIIEIGPGDGRLTEQLLHYEPKELKIIEIDPDLIPILQLKFDKNQNIKIINENVLNYPFVAIGPESMGKKYSKFFKENRNSIFIPIATPGVNTNGYIIRCDGAAIIPLKKLVDDNVYTVEKLVSQIIDNM